MSEKRLLEKSTELFKDAHFANYFLHPDIRNEKVIIDQNGAKHIPDKLIIEGEQVIVIDFKTGEEHSNKHQQQVLEYMSLLEELGYKNVRGELYYTESGSPITVGSE